MHSLVVDASVAIKWLNPAEPLADKANAIRDAYEQGHITLLVPTFLDYEIVNGVNKAVARGDLTEEEGRCLLYTSPSPRDRQKSRMPSSA